jgi:hypothetical protein
MAGSTAIGAALRLVLVVVLGIALGLIGARFVFVGSWLSLIPWGIVCIVIGLISRSWRATVLFAAVFGGSVVLAFELFGYQSTAPLTRALPLFAAIAIVGGISAAAAAALGHAAKVFAHRHRR